MSQRMSDLLAVQAHRNFVGREDEIAALLSVLDPEGPRVLHVHGIAGIGKTALLDHFTRAARNRGATVINLDCRNVEPTESGLLQALGEAIGGVYPDVETLFEHLESTGGTMVLAFDTYEVFRLLDTWLRQVFVPDLPENVRVLFFARQRPLAAWHATPGWGWLLKSVPVKPLSGCEAAKLLTSLGVQPEATSMIVHATHGHPLALKLAAAAAREEPFSHWLPQAPLQHALEELTHIFLKDVEDTTTRQILEGAAITRRTTVSLLGALFPELVPHDGYERLRKLPFVDTTSDGLIIHDAVREAIASSLHASDPSRHLTYRRVAWHQLRAEAESAASGDLWRYTADMLYLIENPVVREAFFPSGTPQFSVEVAQPGDTQALTAIIRAHEGEEAAAAMVQWWRRMPQAFSVVRGADGEALGLCCKLRSDQVEPRWLLDDPVTREWCRHLRDKPMAGGELALFCRRWLSLDEGDSPSEAQAAVWLDLKRTYMELRPALRRVYLTARNLAAYAPVAQRLGIEVLAGREVSLDGNLYPSAVLDFGPASVDGWLAKLAANELGVHTELDLLDPEARELLLDNARVALTPLEFGVMQHLQASQGKAVSRTELLRDVWGTRYEGGSNVVDAVVRTLRRKLGARADRIETVSGVGYRLRPS